MNFLTLAALFLTLFCADARATPVAGAVVTQPGAAAPLAAPAATSATQEDRRRPQRGAQRGTEGDREAVARGERALRDLLVAAGSRPNLPGEWREHVLWYDVAGLRYDSIEILRTRLKQPGAKWRLNHLEPRFFFANGQGRGYLLRELVAPAAERGEFRASFRREVGAGDVYWVEVDGASLRDNEQACLNAQKVMLGEYFYGLMPHSLALFDPQLVWLRNERLEGRPHEVYRLELPAPFEAEFGHASAVFTMYVDPQRNRISQLRFPDPLNENLSVIVEYSSWVRVPVSGAQRDLFVQRLAGTIAGQRDVLGDDGVEALTALLADPDGGLVPTQMLLPSRRSVRDELGGHDREFLAADFRFQPTPDAAFERPWQTGRVWESPWRSDFFDPDDGAEPDDRGAPRTPERAPERVGPEGSDGGDSVDDGSDG